MTILPSRKAERHVSHSQAGGTNYTQSGGKIIGLTRKQDYCVQDGGKFPGGGEHRVCGYVHTDLVQAWRLIR